MAVMHTLLYCIKFCHKFVGKHDSAVLRLSSCNTVLLYWPQVIINIRVWPTLDVQSTSCGKTVKRFKLYHLYLSCPAIQHGLTPPFWKLLLLLLVLYAQKWVLQRAWCWEVKVPQCCATSCHVNCSIDTSGGEVTTDEVLADCSLDVKQKALLYYL